MSMPFRISAASMVLTAALAACGGGGGGGGGVIAPGQTAGNPQEVGFTSFAAVAPNQTVVMSGLSQGGSGTATAFNVGAANESSSSAKLTYDDAGNLTGMSMSTPGSSLFFGKDHIVSMVDTDSGQRTAYRGFDGKSLAVATDPTYYGWNYQSFGVWMTNVGASPFQAGSLSVGAVTPGSAVPTVGSATFSGHAGGFYFDGAGNRFGTDAQMSAVTNFQNRSIQFSTSGTTLQNLADQQIPRVSRSELDMSGNLSYAQGSSRFTGTVNAGNGLSGNATGRFYGPSAQEMGGVYGLSNSSGGRMVGGFGGKR
jgi:C-lobe and N-lobe beta barrels of Tf-binding protein B